MLFRRTMNVALMWMFSASVTWGQQLPPSPEELVELRWSAHLAALIADVCDEFELNNATSLRVTEHLDQLTEQGVDLENHETAYAPPPEFDGNSARWLVSRSNLNGVFVGDDDDCGFADLVYDSDMLAGAMIMRVVSDGNS